jgi:CDGSH-type Zn-finger protein
VRSDRRFQLPCWVCVPKRYVAAMTKITVHDNGPLRIEGDMTSCDASGKEFGLAGRHAVSLCRCGLSDNKPFCDGKHARQGWQSACEATDLPPPKQR